MKISSLLRRALPMFILFCFLSGATACVVVSEPTGRSRRHVKHNKHKHRHCHNKRAKRHKRHKKAKRHRKVKRHKVCHNHKHRNPHH